MPIALAAAYVGLSETTIRAEAAAGRLGAPVRLTPGRLVHLREQLDAYLNRAAGIVPAGDGSEWMEDRPAKPSCVSRYPWRNK
jgi:hypothetical protein